MGANSEARLEIYFSSTESGHTQELQMHTHRAVILYQDWQEIDSFDIEKTAVPSSQFLRESLSMSLWY